MLGYVIAVIVGIWFYMSIVFLIGHIKKDNTVVDIAWGLGFVLIAWLTAWHTGLWLPRHILILCLVTIWGLRLSTHLYLRNKNKGEDPRYAAWRKSWGADVVWRSYVQIYMLQGLCMLIIAIPIKTVLLSTKNSLVTTDLLGLIIFSIGFLFETVGDYQLKQFMRNPANYNKIMDQGLWHFTRHPNYFGEATMWWGIWLIALSVPYAWLAIISPLTITALLLFVSGVPLTEAQYTNNAAYQEYKKRTSAFFPWFVKK